MELFAYIFVIKSLKTEKSDSDFLQCEKTDLSLSRDFVYFDLVKNYD